MFGLFQFVLFDLRYWIDVVLRGDSDASVCTCVRRNWVMEQLAVLWAMHLEVRIQSQSSFGRLEPLRARFPQGTTALPQEVVAEAAYKGVGAYMHGVGRATLQSIFHLQIVNRADLLTRISRHVEIRMRGHATDVDFEPGEAMNEWLVGHPHITEMIAMLAAKALQTRSSIDGCLNGVDAKGAAGHHACVFVHNYARHHHMVGRDVVAMLTHEVTSLKDATACVHQSPIQLSQSKLASHSRAAIGANTGTTALTRSVEFMKHRWSNAQFQCLH